MTNLSRWLVILWRRGQSLWRTRSGETERHLAELRTTLAQHLHELDHNGWNPSTERKVFEVFAALRQAKRSGHSWEALNLYVEKLKNPSATKTKRAWGDLLAWVKPQAEAA